MAARFSTPSQRRWVRAILPLTALAIFLVIAVMLSAQMRAGADPGLSRRVALVRHGGAGANALQTRTSGGASSTATGAVGASTSGPLPLTTAASGGGVAVED